MLYNVDYINCNLENNFLSLPKKKAIYLSDSLTLEPNCFCTVCEIILIDIFIKTVSRPPSPLYSVLRLCHFLSQRTKVFCHAFKLQVVHYLT